MPECKLFLENYKGPYSQGSEIKGRLECYFYNEVTVRRIKVIFRCEEKNEWFKMTMINRKVTQVTYSGNRHIIFGEETLYNSGSGRNASIHGKQIYNFSLVLPNDLIPSSYSGPYGSIIYKLHGIVDILLSRNYQDSCEVKVKCSIDFNKLYRQLQTPEIYTDEITIHGCCLHGGEIIMRAEIPKRTYTPGEIINCKVDIMNMSNANVGSIKATFKEIMTYRVIWPHNDSKWETKNLVSVTDHGVCAHINYTLYLQLKIPDDITVPNFSKCLLYDVSYELEICGIMAFCHWDLNIIIRDIKMGHIPWRPQASLPLRERTHPTSSPHTSDAPPLTLGNFAGINPTAPPISKSLSDFGEPSVLPPEYPEGEEGLRGPTAPVDDTELPPPSYSEAQKLSKHSYPKE